MKGVAAEALSHGKGPLSNEALPSRTRLAGLGEIDSHCPVDRNRRPLGKGESLSTLRIRDARWWEGGKDGRRSRSRYLSDAGSRLLVGGSLGLGARFKTVRTA